MNFPLNPLKHLSICLWNWRERFLYLNLQLLICLEILWILSDRVNYVCPTSFYSILCSVVWSKKIHSVKLQKDIFESLLYRSWYRFVARFAVVYKTADSVWLVIYWYWITCLLILDIYKVIYRILLRVIISNGSHNYLEPLYQYIKWGKAMQM